MRFLNRKSLIATENVPSKEQPIGKWENGICCVVGRPFFYNLLLFSNTVHIRKLKIETAMAYRFLTNT